MILKKLTAVFTALFRRVLRVELDPKVAAGGVGATAAGIAVILAGAAGVTLTPAEIGVITALAPLVAGFWHPPPTV